MIYVDNRVGAKELFPLFKKGSAELVVLEYADVSFLGNGPDCLWPIGVERKRITDLLNSITSGRLAGHQLPGLHNLYRVVYLIIEGLWRPNPRDGSLEMHNHGQWMPVVLGRRRFMAKDVYKYLNTVCVLGGVHLAPCTATPRETVQWVCALYDWWTGKEFCDHTGLDHEYSHVAQFYTKQVPFVQRVASLLPGIGRDKAKHIAREFRTLEELVYADRDRLMQIDGIGKKIADSICKLLRTEEEE